MATTGEKLTTIVKTYLTDLRNIRASGGATGELSYREQKMLGRAMMAEEVQHFTDTARRIAAIVGLTAWPTRKQSLGRNRDPISRIKPHQTTRPHLAIRVKDIDLSPTSEFEDNLV